MLKEHKKEALVKALEPLEAVSADGRKAIYQSMDDLASRGGPEEEALAKTVQNVLELIGK